MLDLHQNYEDVFLYKLDYYRTHPFIRGTIKNLTGENVSLHLELNGEVIHRVSQSSTLSPHTKREFHFNLPKVKKKVVYASGSCQLRISAFQRGKQLLDQTFAIRIRDVHQWNGEVEDLLYFIRPNEPGIFNLARALAQEIKPQPTAIKLTEIVFDYLSKHFQYLNDPSMAAIDYVQFPDELLQRRAGDCEDLSVLYCSLLGALGIQTALVEIKYPEQKDAHIFVLVNTGLKPEQFNFLTQNPNRFIFRENHQGKFNAWLPVELTLVGQPFDKAWEEATEEYQHNAILTGGLAEGWVKVVDVF